MIGLKIRKIRELRNFSQTYVANKLLISQSTYSAIESGKAKVNAQRLAEIALALEVSVDIIESFSETNFFNSSYQLIENKSYSLNQFEKIDFLYNEVINELRNQIQVLIETLRVKDELINVLKNKL